MSDTNEHLAAELDEIPNFGMLALVVADRPIVLFRRDEKVYALDDNCDHTDSPLAGGSVQDYVVTCPWHGAKFDIRNGAKLCPPAYGPTASHRAWVKDGHVYITLCD